MIARLRRPRRRNGRGGVPRATRRRVGSARDAHSVQVVLRRAGEVPGEAKGFDPRRVPAQSHQRDRAPRRRGDGAEARGGDQVAATWRANLVGVRARAAFLRNREGHDKALPRKVAGRPGAASEGNPVAGPTSRSSTTCPWSDSRRRQDAQVEKEVAPLKLGAVDAADWAHWSRPAWPSTPPSRPHPHRRWRRPCRCRPRNKAQLTKLLADVAVPPIKYRRSHDAGTSTPASRSLDEKKLEPYLLETRARRRRCRRPSARRRCCCTPYSGSGAARLARWEDVERVKGRR